MKKLLLAFFILFALCGCSSNQKTSNIVVEKPKDVFNIDEEGELNDIKVSVEIIESTEKYFDRYEPKEGNEYLGVIAHITNNTNKTLKMNNSFGEYVYIYCDNVLMQRYDFNALLSLTESLGVDILDVELEPTRECEGIIAFEIKQDWKKLEVVFEYEDTKMTFIKNK